jgi:hypothetical protein
MVIPLGIVALLLLGALRYLLRSWVDYRVRIAVLQSMDRHPDLLTESDGAGDDVLTAQAPSSSGRVDYLVTGIALGVIGVFCALVGWNLRVGQLAVGAYLGGIFCICIGFLLGLFGFLVRRIRAPRPSKE